MEARCCKPSHNSFLKQGRTFSIIFFGTSCLLTLSHLLYHALSKLAGSEQPHFFCNQAAKYHSEKDQQDGTILEQSPDHDSGDIEEIKE
jgi:hypothetical protein